MRLLTVDDYTHRANNQPMKLAEVGERVRVFRLEKRWTQAALAKKANVSLGTVQALEDAVNRSRPRQTSPEKLQAIARALGKSVDDLIRDRGVIEPSNPLLKGLNDEHLEIAQWYMRARKRTRELVDDLVAKPDDPRLIQLLLRIERLPTALLPQVEGWVESLTDESRPPHTRPAESNKPKQSGTK